jgi:UDP:flavonoid glycosyltransferase YjiC (YdhE family)
MNPTSTPHSFLFTTWEGGGNVAPVVTLARKLVARGHSVRLMSDACNRAEAESAGIVFVPWTRAPSRLMRGRESCPVRDWEAPSPPEGIARLVDRIMLGPALEYAQDLLAELEREPVDLVINSDMLFGVLAGCESIGQRCTIFTANLCYYPLPGLPAFGPGLPPPRNDADRTLHEQIREGTRGLLNSGIGGLNQARLALGLPPVADVMEQLTAAQSILVGTALAFDFPSEMLPASIKYVGPQLDAPGWVASWQSPWPADDLRPLVLVAFSTTFQNHAAVLQRIIDATASLPLRLLVTLGDLTAAELQPADNTVLVSSAPHDAVMPDAKLVITHGGHGTVMRALWHRRPMLILPQGRDQSENAIRVTTRGAGLAPQPPYETAALREAIVRLMEEPHFADAARQLGDAVANESLAPTAVEELEKAARTTGAVNPSALVQREGSSLFSMGCRETARTKQGGHH